MSSEIVNVKTEVTEAPHIWKEVLLALKEKWIWSGKIADKIEELMDAMTINNNWDIISDNKIQLETLKLFLKLYWVKVDQWLNINLFNIPNPNEKLKY
jgi:hypothetical protein